MIEIKHRWDESILWSGEAQDIKAAVVKAAADGANLSGANLSGADLSGANLSGADLSGANLSGASAPIVANIDAAILEAVQSSASGTLDMSTWHQCETTHCRAGWAVHLAGAAGYTLEDRVGPNAAGALIYAASRPGVPVPNFFATDEETLVDLRECAAKPGTSGETP